jgi:hypothetical protein
MPANDWTVINGKGCRRKRWWPNSVTAKSDYKITAYETDKDNNTDTEE